MGWVGWEGGANYYRVRGEEWREITIGVCDEDNSVSMVAMIIISHFPVAIHSEVDLHTSFFQST